jgi:hypothetical protein
LLFKERFRTEVTPKRMYALLKLVKLEKYKRSELANYLQPKELNKNQDVFSVVFRFTTQGNVLEIDPDGFIRCKIDSKDLEGIKAFRRKIARLIFSDKDSNFMNYTAWFLAQNEKIFKYKTQQDIANTLKSEFVNLVEEDLLAWKTWAGFLGIGFLHGSLLVPNLYTRILDCLYTDEDLPLNIEIKFTEFVKWINKNCPECQQGISEKSLSLGLSNGIRLLHDNHIIELKYIADSIDKWFLYKVINHDFPETVSHIIILDKRNE